MNEVQEHAKVGELFLAACDRPLGERMTYVERTCGLDRELASRVRRLLEEDSRAELLVESQSGIRTFEPSTPAPPFPLDDFPSSCSLELGLPYSGGALAAPEIPGYRIDGVVGRGGFGVVYRGKDTERNRDVAIKVLPALVGMTNPAVVERFRREAAAASKLCHQHIVPIYDFGQCESCYYYTMELVTGEPLNERLRHLKERLRRENDGDELFSADYFKKVALWMANVSEALHYAHQHGIVHRDVKPGNLILSVDGRIMVTDFGLALAEDEETMTKTGAVMGTLRYLSPEQALGDRVPVDHRTDIYSVGATLYEFLTLHPLFGHEDERQTLSAIIGKPPRPPSSVNGKTPGDLETICLKALEKIPSARYATAAALGDDLRAFAAGKAITAKRPRISARALKGGRRHKWRITAAIAAMAFVCVALLLLGARSKASVARELDDLLSRALVMQQDKRWDDSADVYLAALEIDPINTRALGNLAIIRKEQYNRLAEPDNELLVEAEQFCRRGLEVAADNAGLWNVMGVIQKKLGNYENAIEAFESGLAIEDAAPTYTIAMLNNIADAHLVAGDWDEAEASIREAAAVADETQTPEWYAWQDLAALEFAQGDAQALVSIARAFAAKKEPNWRMHTTRARIYLGLDDVQDLPLALRDAYAALEEGVPDPRIERVMSLALLRSGKFEEAVAHAELALAFGDIPAYSHLVAALADGNRGDMASATTHLEKARAAWPEDIEEDGYAVSTARGMLWFDTVDELATLWAEAELLLDE